MLVVINGERLDRLYPTYDNIVAAVACIYKPSTDFRRRRRKVARNLGLIPGHPDKGFSICYKSKIIGIISCESSTEWQQLRASVSSEAEQYWSGYEYRSTKFKAWIYYRRFKKRQ